MTKILILLNRDEEWELSDLLAPSRELRHIKLAWGPRSSQSFQLPSFHLLVFLSLSPVFPASIVPPPHLPVLFPVSFPVPFPVPVPVPYSNYSNFRPLENFKLSIAQETRWLEIVHSKEREREEEEMKVNERE